jgi:hypothetical protein
MKLKNDEDSVNAMPYQLVGFALLNARSIAILSYVDYNS